LSGVRAQANLRSCIRRPLRPAPGVARNHHVPTGSPLKMRAKPASWCAATAAGIDGRRSWRSTTPRGPSCGGSCCASRRGGR